MKKTICIFILLFSFVLITFGSDNEDYKVPYDKKNYNIITEKQYNNIYVKINKMSEKRLILLNKEIDKLLSKKISNKNKLLYKDLQKIINDYLKAFSFLNDMYFIDDKNKTDNNIEDVDKQIQKARDTTRINDIKAIESAIIMFYEDNGKYPNEEHFFTGSNSVNISTYLTKIPKDPKEGETINGCNFGYMYGVGPDDNGVPNGAYKLSTCLESIENINSKAKKDGGIYDDKFEIGNGIENKDIIDQYISEFKK